MELLTPAQIDRIHEVTDSLRLHRNGVIVPLAAHATGLELVMPDGNVLVRGPAGSAFNSWIEGLKRRLEALDINRTTPSHLPEVPPDRSSAVAPPGASARRYMDWKRERTDG